MDKLTYTVVEKKGNTFDSFRFGGFNLTLGKVLAQSLVDTASPEKALAGGLYATCAALIDISRKCGYFLSSSVVLCVTDSVIRSCVANVTQCADYVSEIRRNLNRAKSDAERLAYLPVKGLGGNADEQKKRETALQKALQAQRDIIASLNEELEGATIEYRNAVAKLRDAERRFYDEHSKKGDNSNADNSNSNSKN